MCRKRKTPLRARLLRLRALAVCLGDRVYTVKPLDIRVGRPTVAQGLARSRLCSLKFTGEFSKALLVSECMSYLWQTNRDCGWFTVSEDACLLGSTVHVHVRDFDLLCDAGSLFEGPPSATFAKDGDGELCRRQEVPSVSTRGAS